MIGNSLRLARPLAALMTLAVVAASSGASQTPPPNRLRPLTLIDLLERIRTQHPRMGASDARVVAAAGARRAAGVFPNPVLGLAVENATLPGRTPAVGMDRETMATAMLPLEFVYQRGVRVRRADAELDAARAEGTAERQRTALDAVHAYYRTALAQVEVAAAQDLATWLDSLVTYNRNRVSEGVLGESDLLRAELERDRSLADLTLQQTMAIQALAELWAFSGDSGAAMSGRPAVWTPDAPLGVPAPVRGLRAELQAARARLSAAGAGVGVARSFLVRGVSAMAGLKRSVGSTTLLAGLSVPLPLVDQNRGDIARARAELTVAAFEVALTERQVQAELTVASESSRLLAERVAAMQGLAGVLAPVPGAPVGYLARADEARRIALGAYREGAVPLFSVLDAARAWGEARTTYYRTLFAQHESVIALLAAQGRDLFIEIPLVLGAAKEFPR